MYSLILISLRKHSILSIIIINRYEESGVSMDVKRNKVVGSVLRQLRQEGGLTQVQVAERLGRTQSMVSKVEAGERALPFVETWFYAEAIGADPLALFQQSHEALEKAGLEPRKLGE